MNSKIGRRVAIDSESMFLDLNGEKGFALADVDTPSFPAVRVALDSGKVLDLPSICLSQIFWDITTELARPELPAITTPDEQNAATVEAAKLYAIMERNRAEILEVEAQIKIIQEQTAQLIRAEHAELYESQRITAIVFSEHEARLQAGAEALWQAAGQPAKGKTFGAAQIADDWQCVTFDPDKALAYARTQVPALNSTHVDETKFKKAVKDGLLQNVPEDVCKWIKGHKVKTLTAVLSQHVTTMAEPSE